MDWINHVLGSTPFFLLIDGKPKFNTTRIVEAIVIAAIVGGIASYTTLNVISWRLETLERKVDKIYQDIYKPFMGDRAP